MNSSLVACWDDVESSLPTMTVEILIKTFVVQQNIIRFFFKLLFWRCIMDLPSISQPAVTLSQSIKPSLDFCKKFNQTSFQFSHNLAEHPLFQISRLVELANFIATKERSKVVCLTAGQIPIDCKWSDRVHKDQFAEAIARIEASGSLMLINDAQLDPEYKTLLDSIILELEELTGVPLRQQITWVGAYIFITSPNSVTNYHIDHESNFLFQIHGEKEVNLFDQTDRSILTDQELESFYIGDIEAADYKEESQIKASVYHLVPGTGVHHPVNAPHWIRTGAQFSVTLSVLFYLRPFDLKARIYQINYLLRKLKLKPTPPDQSKFLDAIKINFLELFSERKPMKKYDVVRSGMNRLLAPLRLSIKIGKKLKQLPETILYQLPIVSDYYRYYWCFFRNITACRGVFRTFAEAVKALPSNSRISHNQINIHEHSAVAELTACRTLGRLDPVDHPLLPWLKVVLSYSTNVFDFGGNVGVSYYAFQKHLQYPDALQWKVCELPEIVKAGEKIAREMDSRGLLFTTEFSEADGTDILLTCGTLQYVESSLAELLNQLHVKPRHILINHVPFYDGDSFVTLQNIGYAFSPYKIQNRTEFIASLVALGYELIDGWEFERTCSIPFHPERFVKAYDGFYFRLRSE